MRNKEKRAKGRPKRMWFDNIRQWTTPQDYGKVKRAEDRVAWRAITHDDDDQLFNQSL